MVSAERIYFERRAEAELELAQKATHPAAVKAHCELAESYLSRIYGSAGRRDVAPGAEQLVG
jgi:hypothetical protein